jgi:hypothetical protein
LSYSPPLKRRLTEQPVRVSDDFITYAGIRIREEVVRTAIELEDGSAVEGEADIHGWRCKVRQSGDMYWNIMYIIGRTGKDTP